MLVLIPLLLIATAAATTVAVIAHRRAAAASAAADRNESWLEERRTERIRVHTIDDRSIEGSLINIAGDGIVLAAVRLVDAELDLAGDLWIPRPKISMIQQVT